MTDRAAQARGAAAETETPLVPPTRPGRQDDITVCALVPYPPGTAPSQRFRLEQWLPYLREDGITVRLLPFADERLMRQLHRTGGGVAKAAAGLAAVGRRLGHLVQARRFDVVVVHRAIAVMGPALLERALRMLGADIVFDFDDAIYLLHTTEANRALGWLKFPGKTAVLCRLSRHVVVGNSHLEEYARRHNPHVTVVPSSVDTDVFRPRPRRAPSGRLVVGWTGSSTSQAHLEMFAPVLGELTRRRSVEIRVHSDRPPALAGVPFVWRPWSPATEVAELSAFDIGLMPMPDDPWSRGKCAMKALLYMALGIPAVCSDVGTNREVVRHGVNGYLAGTPAEWLAALEVLVDDPALRERLGRAGRETVASEYSMRRSAARFGAVLRSVAAP